MGDHFHHKIMFFRGSFLAQKGSQPSRNPPGPKPEIQGSKNGLQGQKYQICVPKNHAESTSRYSKRSHMLQVMAQNHFGLGAPKVGGNVSADKTSVVSADKTSVVSADKTSVVSADKTSVVSQDIPPTFSTEASRPPLCGQCLGDVLGDRRCLVC